MKPTHVLPDDPALPGLAAIRAGGLASAIPTLGLDPVDLRLIGYSRGQRATLEARTGGRRVAVKCYARDPAGEASVYRALAAAGLTAKGSLVRVPPLLAMVDDLGVIVIGWLEGPTARELVARARGDRAGELAARWLQCAASLDVDLGHAVGVQETLGRAQEWAAALGVADASLGSEAMSLVARLSDTVPSGFDARLVHGRLYTRHLLDVGDACGVIDWERFGRGAIEVDAAMFLATLWRSGQKDDLSFEAARAGDAFMAGTAGLLDDGRLAWFQAAALLSLANHQLARAGSDWLPRAHGILREAQRCVDQGRALALGLADVPADVPVEPATSLGDTRWRSFVDEVASLADELFQGDTAALVCQLVRASDVNADDLARVIGLLQARERELEGAQR